MERRSLAGEWQFREVDTDEWFSGAVPGGVYTDLLAAGEIPDPLVADDELDVQWVSKTDWEYSRTVHVDESFLSHDRVLLKCDGLDTVATVFVNGEEVGRSSNMHVGHEFDVADALEPGANEVMVRFRSPVDYGEERADDYPYEVPCIRYPVDQPGRQFVRKAQCHYGWDWGPCLPTMGIYRDVALVGHSAPRIRYTKTEQAHDGEGIDLTVRIGVDAPSAGEYDLSVAVAGLERMELVSLAAGEQEVETTIVVPDDAVELWWPHDHGDQPLYDLEVTIADPNANADADGTVLDAHTDRVGFREIDLVVEPDEIGTSFHFEVNGTPIFAKGANAIPAAPLYGEVTRERYEHLVRSAADANMNMLRVWGGGYYLDDEFYELCDEHGVLVWQDFMFACSLHPADEEFLETVDAEVRHQVRRLANHPSIALWCANNENEEALYNWFGDHAHHVDHVEDYRQLYEETVAPACREADPSRPYWPGSPSSGPGTDDPYDQSRGDIHYWGVWHEGEPFEDYYDTAPRFVSEFGYQSFPSLDSLSTVLEPDDFNPTSPMMEHHQRNPGGNETILTRLASYFRFPFDFADFVYLTQVQQAVAMDTAIEYWRRRKPETMGAIYWQLNDLWPVASWASIEYDGKWKAQQYAARRQFAPVLVSFHPAFEGRDNAENAQADDADASEWGDVDSQTVWLTSDVAERLTGVVEFQVVTFDGDVVHAEVIDVDHAPRASEPLATFAREDLPADVDATEVMLRAEYVPADGEGVETYPNEAFFEDYKALDLPATAVDIEIDGADVTVRSEAAALFVELDVGTLSGAFSDNYFHLVPGEERTVTFESYEGLSDAASFARFADQLSVQHLRETY